jgi:hypothetical protein
MRKERYASMLLACIGLVATVLACNAPTPTQGPSLVGTPDAASPPSPTQVPPEATPTTALPTATEATATEATATEATATQAAPTETPSGTMPPTPSAARPTPAPPVSTGPLDFVVPGRLDAWQPLDNGGYEATIILNITGGAPPYTIHHDLDVFVTKEAAPAIVFEAQGCSALVHTIIVESTDGQSVTHDYWIPVPWCD